MKNIKHMRILNSLLGLMLAVVLGIAGGATLGKYVFTENLGSVTLTIKPRIAVMEAIAEVAANYNLTRVVFDSWSSGYTDFEYSTLIEKCRIQD